MLLQVNNHQVMVYHEHSPDTIPIQITIISTKNDKPVDIMIDEILDIYDVLIWLKIPKFSIYS